jgi:5-methylcytosine-specific restriction protein A
MFILNNVVPEIRIIPMSKSDEFDNETIEGVQQEYFFNDLIYRQDCKYYYRKQGINSRDGSLVLFQYDNKIIASAQLKDVEKYDDIKVGEYGEYSGAIVFYKETIQVFQPIEANELKNIDLKFNKFSQTKQFLNINNLEQILNLLKDKKKQYNMTYQEKILSVIVIDETFKDIPKERNEVGKRFISQWSRDPVVAKRALINAKYKCAIDPSHEHFKAKSTGENYVESHHLIPMCNQDDFDKSLDSEANIVCLCAVCHKKLHHADLNEKVDMLDALFKTREKRLKMCGISISFDELLELYK